MTSISSSTRVTTGATSEHGQLPLAPIDRPKGWFMRSLFSAFRKRYGLTPTAFRVMYARSPFLAFVSLVLGLGLLRFLKIVIVKSIDQIMIERSSIIKSAAYCTMCTY